MWRRKVGSYYYWNNFPPVSSPKLDFVYLIVLLSVIRSFKGEDEGTGPDVWNEECRLGTHQSPINIPNRKFGNRWGFTSIWLNEPYFRDNIGFYAANTGKTFQIQFTENRTDPTSSLVLSGGGLRQTYIFSQMHFHWADKDDMGSEHTLEGIRYPMELHIVHYKSIHGNLTNALRQSDPESIAVLAIIFQIGPENPALRGLVEAEKSKIVTYPQPKFKYFSNLTINVASLLPTNLNFIRYEGSLTTSPCRESVAWSVFLTPVSISRSQLDSFRRLRNFEKKKISNVRQLQGLNQRALKYYISFGWIRGVSPLAWFQNTTYYALANLRSFVFGFFTKLLNSFFLPTII